MDTLGTHDEKQVTRPPGPKPPGDLKRIRLLVGYSQRALAESAGISRRALIALEAERAQPRLETAQRLSDVLEVDIGVIFPQRHFPIRPAR
jgi:DNA-binding XRE family transcriptional regulator